MDDEAAETVTITAVDTTASPAVTVTQTATIVYSAGAPDPNVPTSTVTASPNNPPSDGTTPTTVSVTLTDQFGNFVSGQAITLSALPTGNSRGHHRRGRHHELIRRRHLYRHRRHGRSGDVSGEHHGVWCQYAVDVRGVVHSEIPRFPRRWPSSARWSRPPQPFLADGATSATVSVLLYNGAGDAVRARR